MRQINHTRGFCSREGGKAAEGEGGGSINQSLHSLTPQKESLATQHTGEQTCMCALVCVYLSEQERGGILMGKRVSVRKC